MDYPMPDLKEMLQRSPFEFRVDEVVKWVGDIQNNMDALMELLQGDNEPLSQRAAWVIGHVGESCPRLALPHLETLVELVRQPHLHNGIIRNILRLLQFAEIPVHLHGRLMDACFGCIENPAEKVAIKANALTILHHLSRLYPEILPEIKAVIQSRMEMETAAFKARAKIFLK